MTGVLLDIGAGSTKFVRMFRQFNPRYRLMYLCGEPDWKNSWSGEKTERKILKISASYDRFNVPDACLHFVTLNAYHPLMSPQGIKDELIRTLIPSRGVFISAHPAGYHPELPEEFFYPVAFKDSSKDDYSLTTNTFSGKRGVFGRPICLVSIDRYPVMHYPASPTIYSRLRELRLSIELRNRSSSYCYSRSNRSPSLKVWLRNERPIPRFV